MKSKLLGIVRTLGGVADALRSARGAGAVASKEARLDADEDADFSEEFGAARGFAGGSGFEYGEFERWT